jgi:tubulin--tyrosine ligase
VFTFEAAARGMMVHFQPLPNAFELFGVDFMLDADGGVYLLEINAFPDFAQTGDELNSIVQGLFEEVVDVAIKPFFGLSTEEEQSAERENMALALDIDLGRN